MFTVWLPTVTARAKNNISLVPRPHPGSGLGTRLEQYRIGRARARPGPPLATPLESSRDVLDCRLLLTSKFLSAGKPLAVRIRSKTGGPGECAPNRGSHGQTVRVGRSAVSSGL